MIQKCEIEVNGEKIKAVKEINLTKNNDDTISYKFFYNEEQIGGFTVKYYNDALYKKRIVWDFKNKEKYNRYYLEKMARFADEKLKGEEE